MGSHAEEARRAVQSLGNRGLRSRVSDPVRSVVVAYARKARRSGTPWSVIASEVGLSKSAISRWMREGSDAGSGFRTVQVSASQETRGVVVVASSGDRVEGLTVAEAAELLRRLR